MTYGLNFARHNRMHEMDLISIRTCNVKCDDESARGTDKELKQLADSIFKLGILQPLILNSKHELISGRRRLFAARQLELSHVPAVVCQTLDDVCRAKLAERDENTCRLGLSKSEAVAIGKEIEVLMKPIADAAREASKAKPGQAADKREGKIPSRSKPEENAKVGKTEDAGAQAADMSPRTYRQAKEIVESGDEELIEEMDSTGKVDPVHKKLKEKEAEAEPEEDKDPLGTAAAAFCTKLNGYTRTVDTWSKEFTELKAEPLAHHVHWETVLSQLTAIRKAIHQGRPKRRCPYCKATGKKGREPCKSCKGTGHVCESIYRSGCAAVGAPPEADGDE